MRQRFRQVLHYGGVGILWVVFASATGLCYWTRTRYSSSFFVSHMEWTAFTAYIAALALTAGYQVISSAGSYNRLSRDIAITTAIFTLTGWILESRLYLNADDSEKSDGALIALGVSLLPSLSQF